MPQIISQITSSLAFVIIMKIALISIIVIPLFRKYKVFSIILAIIMFLVSFEMFIIIAVFVGIIVPLFRKFTFLSDNIVPIIFLFFMVFGFFASDSVSVSSFLNEVLTRFFRNGLLVLSLIIPVMAGLGLNFGIVVGAFAGILAIIPVRYFGLSGISLFGGFSGLMMCFLLALPLALLFGFLTGKLYNKTRGQELISSLIVGYFAEGLYLIFVLIIIGGVIPVADNHPMIIPFTNVGIRTSFDMGPHPSLIKDFDKETPGLKYALDYLWRVEFLHALIFVAVCLLIFLIVRRILAKNNPLVHQSSKKTFIFSCIMCGVLILLGLHGMFLPNGIILRFQAGGFGVKIPPSFLTDVKKIPAATGLVIAGFCLFTHYFTKTKLGQDCRSVGQSQHIAKVSGINVDRTRIIATMISTVFAAWGMIIYLQEMGTVSTYTSHRQIGLFSVAALLVGGATAAKANVKNALLGLLLFHAMFIVSPGIGRLISNSEGVSEYFRSFMVYAVIGLSLGLYIWKGNKAATNKETLEELPAQDKK